MSISQNFPAIKPELLIDLQNVGKLDPRISFSRASVGTYYDANGVLQTAGTNEPRFDHDPVTGASKGLLRENQATNLVTYSEDFADASWTKTNVTVQSNVVVAPDGTLTGDLFDEGTDTNVHRFQKSFTFSATAEYTFSVYVRDVNIRFISLSFTGQNNAYFGATFDLTDETVTATRAAGSGYSYTSSSVTPIGGGWYKLVVSGVRGGLTSSAFVFISGGTSSTPTVDGRGSESYTGTNRQFYIWGAQLEAGAIPTSYIKTEASQVTRAADSAVLTNTDAYNTTEFTAVSQPFGVSSVSATQTVLNGDVPIERLYVYPRNITQDQINAVNQNDGWWSWRIIGSSFALPSFATDGTVEVDWGDGTVETLTTAVHTFTNASPHTIRFRQMTGTWFKPQVNGGLYGNMIVALGSAPSNMIVNFYAGLRYCNNLKSFDATLSSPAIEFGWENCASLTSFPFIDASTAASARQSWSGCTSLASFPAIDLPVCTNFTSAWRGCSSLTSFPLVDTSSGTNFQSTWNGCSSLTSFPLIDTSAGTDFFQTWENCPNLTSFPLINTSLGTRFERTWRACAGLTAFPLININNSTTFSLCWNGCTALTDFPANMFDSWTGVPVANCFLNTWLANNALTTTSVENILVSIDTSGVSAPATGTEITIDYSVATGALTAPTTSAITSLKGKNWTIKINGVLQ